jgi:hypothetical protein
MADQTLKQEAELTKTGKWVPLILKWVILGLVVFTCVMAAIRKFG